MDTIRSGAGTCREPVAAKQPLLDVEIARRALAWADVEDDLLVRAARAAFAAVREDAGASEVSLLLTNDDEVAALNKTWRGKEGPTNVLSFRLDAPHCDAAPEPLGDVVLARETVEREAAERGIPAGQHTAHLVVHGVLHLMGYDHTGDHEAAEMEALEARILATLGFRSPYSSHRVAQGEAQ